MAEVHHFAYDWVTPILAYVMSAVGSLLGLLLMAKARIRRGRARNRLLIYAAVAIGGTGIWLMHFVGMLGFDVPASNVRYDLWLTAASLAIAVLIVGAGLFLAGHGRLGFWRLVGAGTLVGFGISAMHYTGMAGVRVSGVIDYEQRPFVISVVLAMAIASAALWFSVALKGPRATVVAALVMGLAISSMHYTGMAAVRVHLSPDHAGVSGIDPIFLISPIVLLGAATIAMVAFFTFGNSTVEEVRAIYTTHGDEPTGAIESRVLAEVMARVTSETPAVPLALTAGPPRFGAARFGRTNASPRRAPGPRPTPGVMPTWRSMPVWGSDLEQTVPVPTGTAGAGPVSGQIAVATGPATALPRRYPPPRSVAEPPSGTKPANAGKTADPDKKGGNSQAPGRLNREGRLSRGERLSREDWRNGRSV
jgi:NO-binding membrane sensor protein with MHYT domain